MFKLIHYDIIYLFYSLDKPSGKATVYKSGSDGVTVVPFSAVLSATMVCPTAALPDANKQGNVNITLAFLTG